MPAFRRNLVLLLCIAFVAASVATAIFYGLIGGKLRDASSDAPRQAIVVAARNLERGTVVQAADVKLSTWGGAERLKGSYTAVDQIAGKTVYSPVQENEPITEARVAGRDGTGGMGIASGMRAISVHASDSSGVMSLLRAGQKVDVQVVSDRQGGETRLRTVLENVEVLAIHPPEGTGGRSAAPVVTLLVTPAAADRLGLADSGARIRLLLRNPVDQSEDTRPVLTLANVFGDRNYGRGSRGERKLRAGVAGVRATRSEVAAHDGGISGHVDLLVRVAAIEPKAIEELTGHAARRAGALEVVELPAGPQLDRVISGLEESHQIEVLSSTRLAGRNHHMVSMQAGTGRVTGDARGTWSLRIRFRPALGGNGVLRVRVRPEITSSRSNGLSVRKMETEVEVSSGHSFAVVGLIDAGDWPAISQSLFRGRFKEMGNRELVVLVTPEVQQPVHAAALAHGR